MITLVLYAMNAYAYKEMKSSQSQAMLKASNVIGASVTNPEGEKLGSISDLTMSANGRVRFAILSSGGVLGMGGKLIAVPMKALSFKDDKNAILDISKKKLATAPSFDEKDWPDMSDRQWSEDTFRFYGVSPFWKDKSAKKEKIEMKKQAPGYGSPGYGAPRAPESLK
jgi:sporulation protein YlmC with PRC-barrel domain